MRYKDELVNALVKELVAEKDYLAGETVHTIYFGGGTPSLLHPSECATILDALRTHYPVAPNAEITLEANPDDISTEKLDGWKAAGINRLSIGIQSFADEELRWMNRAHNSSQALTGLELAVQAFDNITLDLIYGSPMLTDEQWHAHVHRAIAAGVPHLSCYALTVEEKTPLSKLIGAQRSADVDSDKQARQFLLLMQWLREAGYEHYEVSNFARPGYRSRHNSSYWSGAKYLGIGPSAHSYNGRGRRWNAANNTAYITGINTGQPQRGIEELTPAQQRNEYIMIALRTSEGIDLSYLETHWDAAFRQRIEAQLAPFIRRGLVEIREGHARLTDEGMLLADGVASGLFEV